MLARILLFSIALIGAFFVLGSLGIRLLNRKASVPRAVTWGFAIALAVFHVLAYPMFRLECSFSLLVCCYSVCILLLLLYGLYLLVRHREILSYGAWFGRLIQDIKKTPLLYAAAAACVGVYFAAILLFTYASSDDSYYIARAMEVLSSDSLAVSHGFAWFGRENAAWLPASDASTLEFFKAYLSLCSGLPVLVVCRAVLAAVLSLVSLFAVYNLAGDISGDHEHTPRVQLLTVAFFCFFTYCRSFFDDTEAFWTLRYIWQGKSILCGIIFPMIFSGCIQIIRCHDEPIPAGHWVEMAFLLTAGIASSIVGAFLPFLCYLMVGLPYLLSCGWKRGARMLLPIIASLTPVIIYSGLTFLSVVTENTQYLTARSIPEWGAVFQNMFDGSNYFGLVVYLLAIAYVVLRGSREEKLLFAAPPILQFFTLLNPLLIGFVSRYITTGSVYFRLYWILPVCFLPAFVLGSVLGRKFVPHLRDYLRGAAALVCVVLVLDVFSFGPKGTIFNQMVAHNQAAGANIRWNYYGISSDAIDIAEVILEDHVGEDRPMVLSDDAGELLRQYTSEIALANFVRTSGYAKMTESIPGTEFTEGEFYTKFFAGEITDADTLYTVLKAVGVDYIVLLDAETEILPRDAAWLSPMGIFGPNHLWKVT